MIGMARTWALELAPDGITVNVVAPGPVQQTISGASSLKGLTAKPALLPNCRWAALAPLAMCPMPFCFSAILRMDLSRAKLFMSVAVAAWEH